MAICPNQGFWQGAEKKLKLCGIWGQIVRDKNSIMRDIARDCAILRQTKYFVSFPLSKQTLNSSSHTFLSP